MRDRPFCVRFHLSLFSELRVLKEEVTIMINYPFCVDLSLGIPFD